MKVFVSEDTLIFMNEDLFFFKGSDTIIQELQYTCI